MMRRVFGLYFLMGMLMACGNVPDVNKSLLVYDDVSFKDSIPNFDNDSAISSMLDSYKVHWMDKRSFHGKNSTVKSLYFQDVKKDFQEHCNACHNSSGRAPFSFDSYGKIRRKAKSIRESLETMVMPPWLATQKAGTYCNEQLMPDEARARMIAWIDQGCKLLDETNADEKTFLPVQLEDSILHIVKGMHPYELQSDSDIYVCRVYDPQFATDTFVSSIELSSSAADMVHHFSIFLDTLGLISADDTPWITGTKEDIQVQLVPMEGWTKGIRSIIYEPELAYRIPKGAKFMVETHYSGYGNKGRTENSDLVLRPTGKPKDLVNWLVLVNDKLHIPANEVRVQSIVHKIDTATTILGVFPHMHYLGRDVSVFGVKPNGEVLPMVDIVQWDYMLQGKFMLKDPIYLPAGSYIVTNALYDNTDKNPRQPNDPIKDVAWGKNGTDEMLVLMVYYSLGKVETDGSCLVRLVK